MWPHETTLSTYHACHGRSARVVLITWAGSPSHVSEVAQASRLRYYDGPSVKRQKTLLRKMDGMFSSEEGSAEEKGRVAGESRSARPGVSDRRSV